MLSGRRSSLFLSADRKLGREVHSPVPRYHNSRAEDRRRSYSHPECGPDGDERKESEKQGRRYRRSRRLETIIVVPIIFPFTIGAASLSYVITLMSSAHVTLDYIGLTAIILLDAVSIFLTYLIAVPLGQRIGSTGEQHHRPDRRHYCPGTWVDDSFRWTEGSAARAGGLKAHCFTVRSLQIGIYPI